MSAEVDARWMADAIALGELGRGRTAPNPNVGCVIVRDGRVVGSGTTHPGGRPHAEAVALKEAGEAALGATLYTTLEPCAHASTRGPACADLTIASGLARVRVALRDPDPRTSGEGMARIAAAGIAVDLGTGAAEAARSMAGFLSRTTRGRPFVTLKLAQSIDGRIALPDGTSRWITGEDARTHAHYLRAASDAILIGRGTFEADAPRLDVRIPGLEDRSPRRYMLTRGATPEGWTVLPDPQGIFAMNDVNDLLVEGGAATAAAFVRADLVDRMVIYTAPVIIGAGRAAIGDIGLSSLADAHGRWTRVDGAILGSDRLDVYERT